MAAEAALGRVGLILAIEISTNPFAGAGGDIFGAVKSVCEVIEKQFGNRTTAQALHADAVTQGISVDKIISTDPPYYDNIGYADLSDFFYVWLRRSLRMVFPDPLSTMATPKAEELVAAPYRRRTKAQAEVSFMKGMSQALKEMARQSHPGFPRRSTTRLSNQNGTERSA